MGTAVSKKTLYWRHLCHAFTYVHSLLIEKDGCARRNISLKFPCVFVCLSYSDRFNFWQEFSLSFPHGLFIITSVRRWFCCLSLERISWVVGLAWWTARFICNGRPPRSQLSVKVARCLFTSRTLALCSSRRSCWASVHCSYRHQKYIRESTITIFLLTC